MNLRYRPRDADNLAGEGEKVSREDILPRTWHVWKWADCVLTAAKGMLMTEERRPMRERGQIKIMRAEGWKEEGGDGRGKGSGGKSEGCGD